jgi:uncharacterized membrane protein YjgN (DUF898 family)
MTISISPAGGVDAAGGIDAAGAAEGEGVAGGGAMDFTGRGRTFLRLLVTGSLLQIPTFGFYRFWFVTRLRRHLWANTRVAGEAFEYTGTAKELLVGFLIALAVLTPIYLGYFLVGILLEEQKEFASLPLGILMYALTHFAAYRARRYRASRTVFRGVRFWMSGSGWTYAARAIKWDILNLLSLGLSLPWAMASLERYRMRHTHFGDLPGVFVGTGADLFRRGGGIWLILALSIAAWLLSYHFLSPLLVGERQRKTYLALTFCGVILVFLAAIPAAMAVFTRWKVAGLRFGPVSVESRLRKRAVYGVFLKLVLSWTGFVIVSVVCYFALTNVWIVYSGGNYPSLTGGRSLMSSDITLFVGGTIAFYLLVFMGFGILNRYFLGRGLWAVTAGSAMVSGMAAVDAVVAAGQADSALGEGLADALDFDIGL